MMNGPYYRNNSRSVPVQKPKVVSIPVHFVSSDKPQTNISTLKHSSALKIQKVFRGHTVRKSVNKIVSIKNQVNEIENRLQNDVEFVQLLHNDGKERLRVNETLMSLLFKLDSVRGVENGVRDLRKSVAKKAVALQENVDSIAQTFEQDHDDVSNGDDDVSNSIGCKLNEEDVKEDVVNEVGVTEEGTMECGGGDDDVSKRCCDKGMVEKLMCDNAKMMKLMIQISERNEMQTRMINSLSKRVEQLEKAFMSDKSRRRKKSHTRREKDAFCI